MFAYVCLGTNNLPAALAFYDEALAPLGLRRRTPPGEETVTGWVNWGRMDGHGSAALALWVCAPFDGRAATAGNGTMIALEARTWAAVQAFHAAALRNGGTSEGEPGLRPQYGDDFYAAYVRDPDGNKLAAVCRGFTSAP